MLRWYVLSVLCAIDASSERFLLVFLKDFTSVHKCLPPPSILSRASEFVSKQR